jgi:DNA (cytosine-5)-methyltransferase 1
MLDMGFEQEGFCVVRGPDLLWGGDIRTFHPPGVFDGVIGGPPCPSHSRLRHQSEASGNTIAEDLVPEFARVVTEAEPAWWLMENTPACPEPFTSSQRIILNNRWLGGVASRKRVIYSNLTLHVGGTALEPFDWEHAVTSHAKPVPVALAPSGKRKPGADLPPRTLGDVLELQGLPPDWLDHQPWTVQAKRKMVGNGVPIPMARALARAVRKALDAPRGLSIL